MRHYETVSAGCKLLKSLDGFVRCCVFPVITLQYTKKDTFKSHLIKKN